MACRPFSFKVGFIFSPAFADSGMTVWKSWKASFAGISSFEAETEEGFIGQKRPWMRAEPGDPLCFLYLKTKQHFLLYWGLDWMALWDPFLPSAVLCVYCIWTANPSNVAWFNLFLFLVFRAWKGAKIKLLFWADSYSC